MWRFTVHPISHSYDLIYDKIALVRIKRKGIIP